MKVKELMLKCEGLEQRNLEMIDEKWELRGKLRKAEAKLEKYEWALDVKQKYIEKVEKENEQLRQSIDSMIETSAEISKRNVELWEKIGELQKCKKDSPTKMGNTMTKDKN